MQAHWNFKERNNKSECSAKPFSHLSSVLTLVSPGEGDWILPAETLDINNVVNIIVAAAERVGGGGEGVEMRSPRS